MRPTHAMSAAGVPARVAVIGGGVAGSALVYGLREHIAAKAVQVHCFEMGRGSGGRASTRKTRDSPELRVDHGAPSFSAHTPSFSALCESLAAVLERAPAAGFGVLRAKAGFAAESSATSPARFQPREGHGMADFSDALVRGGDASAEPLAEVTYNTLVTGIASTEQGWQLTAQDGRDLGSFDWLCLATAAPAHPRWSQNFGGEPPLAVAAAALGDEGLHVSLRSVAEIRNKPVAACMLAYESEAADAWARLPFIKAVVEGDPVLSRIVVQRGANGPRWRTVAGRALPVSGAVAVVLHSTHAFAESHLHVIGDRGTAARVSDADAQDPDAAAARKGVVDQLLAAAEAHLAASGLDRNLFRNPAWGPHLHRWGAAFPDGLLAEEHALVPSARVAFCGDFVATPPHRARAASVEGAALSGMRTADRLLSAIQTPQD